MELTLKEQGFYKTPAWRRRVLALQRDNYLCIDCLESKRITRATEVHHTKSVDTHPELALTLDNLMSLCWNCHEKTKHKLGKKQVSFRARVITIRDGDVSDDGNAPPP